MSDLFDVRVMASHSAQSAHISSPSHVRVEPLLQQLVCLCLILDNILLPSFHHFVELLHDLLLCGAVYRGDTLLHFVEQRGRASAAKPAPCLQAESTESSH